MTESRNVIFIETPASTLADSTGGNTTGVAVSTHEDSSPAENTEDICITYSEEMESLLKKCRSSRVGIWTTQHQLARRNRPLKTPAVTKHSRRPGQEHGRQTTNSKAPHVGAHANCASTPVSRKGLYLHQQRELPNLGLHTSPMVSDAEVAHEKENTMEYALVGETEHRPDGAQEHRMEVYLDYALDTGNPVSEHSSDGEVITIPIHSRRRWNRHK